MWGFKTQGTENHLKAEDPFGKPLAKPAVPFWKPLDGLQLIFEPDLRRLGLHSWMTPPFFRNKVTASADSARNSDLDLIERL